MKKIVFIGDSITWCWKSEEDVIGTGYVRLIHDYLKVSDTNQEFEILNQGISGNRVTDLRARFDQDVIGLKPDFVSISIGINDVWRQLDSPEIEQVFPDEFEDVYRSLLLDIKEKTTAKIILMEPTIIGEDVQSEGNLKLKPYVKIVHQLAEEFHAILVPTHEAFLSYLQSGNRDALTTDGVHMTSLGNMLMAKTWIEATKSLFS